MGIINKKNLNQYNLENLHVGTLGGHSALDVGLGAKKQGLKTVAVCQQGREKTFSKYYKNLFDKIIVTNKFADLTSTKIIKQLQKFKTIFVQSRYFWVYCNHQEIKDSFPVPIFGTRGLVEKEERNVPKNQYYLMKQAGIRYPKIYSKPKDIDRLVLVKVPEAVREYERAFFFANNKVEYHKKAEQLLTKGLINKKGLKKAVIEECLVGTHANFNFFYSPLKDRLELLGTDTRRATNISGLTNLPANQQLEILKHIQPQYIETGHIACTVKESILEKAFLLGEKLVETLKKEFPPGIIGPFALQTMYVPGPPREELVTFDLSLRIPGSPGTSYTPYSRYLFGRDVSVGERIAMEIKQGVKNKQIDKITT